MSGSNQFHDFPETDPAATEEYGHGPYNPAPGSQRGPSVPPAVYGGDFSHGALSYDSNAAALAPPVANMYTGLGYAGIDVLECSPTYGPVGTEVSVSLRTRQPLRPHTAALLVADGIRSDGRLLYTDGSEGFQYYILKAPAPRTSRSASNERVQVPLQVQLEDPTGQVISVVEAGAFAYEPSFQTSKGRTASQEGSRKRRVSVDSHTSHAPIKKTSSQQLHARAQEQPRRASSAFGSESATDSLVPSPGPPSASSSAFSSQMVPLRGTINVPHRSSGDELSTSISSVHSSTGHPSPTIGSANNPRSEPPIGAGPLNTSARHAGLDPGASTRSNANPPLVRTSTVAHNATRASQGSPVPPESFNPYTIYAENKALLEIKGNLDSMAHNWTEEERRSQRRLVEFSREQEGNHVTTTFKPVTLEDRAPNSICVSCIWWPEKEEAYVTSVDTIQLLESLVAVRFTVEEKNRIRRNLEGFRPKTVAKGKSDSEHFFKTIMDFPSPKPRNIEKDVKVFPWRVLKHALKKIVGKYSASYASTQARIPQPAPSGHAMAGAGYEQLSLPETAYDAPSVIRAHSSRPPPYPRPYDTDMRNAIPPGPHTFPMYAMAPPPIQQHQVQHPSLQYGPIQPHQPVPYDTVGYAISDPQWHRTLGVGGEDEERGETALRPQQQAQQILDMRQMPYGAYAQHQVDVSGQQARRQGQPYLSQHQAHPARAPSQAYNQHVAAGSQLAIPDNRFHQYGRYSPPESPH